MSRVQVLLPLLFYAFCGGKPFKRELRPLCPCYFFIFLTLVGESLSNGSYLPLLFFYLFDFSGGKPFRRELRPLCPCFFCVYFYTKKNENSTDFHNIYCLKRDTIPTFSKETLDKALVSAYY